MQKISLPNITSLRFFLALLVVIYHIPQFCNNRGWPSFSSLPLFNRGPEAVYVFFSLSGFLIIRNLFYEKLKTGTISIKNFYKRRALRIFPLYYAVLIFGLLYYNIILPNLGFHIESGQYSILQGILLGGTFFSNILATFKPGGIIEILWSIGIEEQFYLLVAPIFLLIPARRLLLFLLLFTIFYFTIFHTSLFSILKEFKLYFYFFSISGIVAINNILHPNLQIHNYIKFLIYFLFFVYFTTDIFIDNLSDFWYQFLSMILFPIFILCIIQIPYKTLENKKLKYLGKISYGIYMLHAIAMQFAGFIFYCFNSKDWDDKPIIFIISFNLITILFTILLAHLSYQYFERIFFRFKTSKQSSIISKS